MNDFKLTRRRTLLGAAAVALAACAPSATQPSANASATVISPKNSKSFKFLFGFTVQANPTLPVILAKELGYYAAQGIDIAWDFTTQGVQAIQLTGVNQYQASSVADIGAIADAVASGVPIKGISMASQRSGRALAVRKGSGISRPKDFEGKKVGVKGARAWSEYLAMLAYDKVDRSKIKEIPIGFSSVELKDGTVDVLPVFTGNEPFVLANQLNVDIDLLLPGDFGYPSVGTMLIANTQVLGSDRDLMIRFLKATMKAQEGFLANRDQTIQVAVQYGGTATTRAQHEFIYDVSKRDMEAGEAKSKGPGWISKDVVQQNIDLLASLGVLKSKPRLEDLVDTSFMEEILKDGKVVYP